MRTKNFTCIGTALLSFPIFIEPERGLPCAIPVHPFIYNVGSHSANSNPIANIDDEPKKPSEKGDWVTKSFNISCMTDRGLSKETYAIGAVDSQSRVAAIASDRICISKIEALNTLRTLISME
jgi:hypothetical protein